MTAIGKWRMLRYIGNSRPSDLNSPLTLTLSPRR